MLHCPFVKRGSVEALVMSNKFAVRTQPHESVACYYQPSWFRPETTLVPILHPSADFFWGPSGLPALPWVGTPPCGGGVTSELRLLELRPIAPPRCLATLAGGPALIPRSSGPLLGPATLPSHPWALAPVQTPLLRFYNDHRMASIFSRRFIARNPLARNQLQW